MKVGVVGVGWAGQQHIKAYAAMEGVTLAGIAGLEEETRERLAAEFGVPVSVARWEDLLDVDGLEAISVAVPTFLHAPIAIAALERGLHVLSEKPIALERRPGGRRWSRRRAPPAACSTSRSTTGAAATSRSCAG